MKKLFIFDFDGVIAFLFEKYNLKPAREVIIERLSSYGVDATRHENMFTVSEVISSSSISEEDKRKAFQEVDGILCRCETEAIEDADAVPGLMEILPRIAEKGVKIAVASNNNPEAVRSFLSSRFPGLDIPVWGREEMHPEDMKPSSYMLDKAMEYYQEEKKDTVFFGDAVSDYEAARNAGVDFYGFIPSEKKRIRMEKILPKDKLLHDWFELWSVFCDKVF